MAAHAHAADGPHHDDHHVEEHFTPTPILVGLGTFVLYLTLELRDVVGIPWLPALGVLVFVVPLLMWMREDVQFWREKRVDHGVMPGHPLGWWGMMFFLATEISLFASLFAAFFVARAQNPDIWANAAEHVSHALPLVTVNTLILVASGGFMHWALVSIRKNNRRNFLIGLLGTLVLGAVFLVIQVSEYTTLIASGVTFSGDNFGNAFYGLTGTHAAHVFLGLCFIGFVFVRGLLGQYDKDRHVSVDAFAIYWHFVDVVWIGLYFIVYVGVI